MRKGKFSFQPYLYSPWVNCIFPQKNLFQWSSELLELSFCSSGVHVSVCASLLPSVHRWASASKKLTPASAFRHPSSQSGTGPKKCRTAQLNFGTGLFPVSLIFLSPVPDYPDAGHSGIPALQCCVAASSSCISCSQQKFWCDSGGSGSGSYPTLNHKYASFLQ
jgi:hypothetical protein